MHAYMTGTMEKCSNNSRKSTQRKRSEDDTLTVMHNGGGQRSGHTLTQHIYTYTIPHKACKYRTLHMYLYINWLCVNKHIHTHTHTHMYTAIQESVRRGGRPGGEVHCTDEEAAADSGRGAPDGCPVAAFPCPSCWYSATYNRLSISFGTGLISVFSSFSTWKSAMRSLSVMRLIPMPRWPKRPERPMRWR